MNAGREKRWLSGAKEKDHKGMIPNMAGFREGGPIKEDRMEMFDGRCGRMDEIIMNIYRKQASLNGLQRAIMNLTPSRASLPDNSSVVSLTSKSLRSRKSLLARLNRKSRSDVAQDLANAKPVLLTLKLSSSSFLDACVQDAATRLPLYIIETEGKLVIWAE
jgi:hypothetical protein